MWGCMRFLFGIIAYLGTPDFLRFSCALAVRDIDIGFESFAALHLGVYGIFCYSPFFIIIYEMFQTHFYRKNKACTQYFIKNYFQL